MSEDRRSFGERLTYWWHESLVRHVRIEKETKTALNLPLLVVIVAAVVAPWLAAGAVIVALVMGYHIRMSREQETSGSQPAAEGEVTTAPEWDLTTADAPAPPPAPPAPPAAESPPSESNIVGGADVSPGQPEEPPAPQG